MYKIIKITDEMGTNRTDGRYPLRIGCVGETTYLKEGFPMYFTYSLDANGNVKEGTLQTSSVTKIVHEARHVEVTTRNSVYTLAML